MQLRKRSRPLRMFNRDWQGRETMILDGLPQSMAKDQLPQATLDRNLPNCYCADEDLILRRGNGRAKRLQQMIIV